MSAAAPPAEILAGLQAAGLLDVRPPAAEEAIDETSPQAVVSPASEEEVASLLRYAAGRDLVLIPCGGGTALDLGAIPERVDVMVRLTKLDEVHYFDPGDLTLSVGAGMTVDAVQALLAEHKLFLPLDPMLPHRATIGGVLAANAGGPLKSGFGGAREFCIGIEFVTPEGRRAKAGGRVVKNVAGYDLMKLLIGSLGTLGVITAANFKVFPLPPQTATFQCGFADASAAIRFGKKVWASAVGSRVLCLEIISPRAQEYLCDGWDPRDPDHFAPVTPVQHHTAWTVSLRVGGSEAVLDRVRRELGGASSAVLAAGPELAWWRWVADFEAKLVHRHQNAMLIAISTPPSAGAEALAAAEQTALEHNLVFSAVGRIPAGSYLVGLAPLAVDPPSAMQYANMASALRARLSKETSAVVVRCPTEAKRHFDVWGSTPTDLSLMRAIRRAMDPRQILNRGRFLV
jgi:glycolate oxidase FAD binding subunit